MKRQSTFFRSAMILAAVILLSCQKTTPASAQYVLQNAFPSLAPFTNPVDLQSIPDGSNRFVVVEQAGRVYVVPNVPTTSSKKLMLDMVDSVISGGEMGLLGCAFHPNFAQNHYVFFNYTYRNLDDELFSYVSRFTVSGANFDTILRSTEKVIMIVDQPYENHNGGGLAFGPDGYLYIGFGDGGAGGDPQNNGQKLTTLLGKMLRIDVDATQGNYGIPATNPYKGNTSGYKEEIFAYGLRNPWRYSFDSETGQLWCGDVGQGAWEEIDIIELGKNYGWKIMEGTHCYPPGPETCNKSGLELPIFEYSHSVGASITGGYVYRGNKLPELKGKYIYGDINGKVWALTPGTPATSQLLGTLSYTVSSFGVTPDKEVLVVHHGTGNGRLYKIVNTASVDDAHTSKALQVHLGSTVLSRPLSVLPLHIESAGSSRLSIKLVDALAKEFSLGEHSIAGNTADIRVDLKPIAKSLSAGIYFLRVSDGVNAVSEKVIVE